MNPIAQLMAWWREGYEMDAEEEALKDEHEDMVSHDRGTGNGEVAGTMFGGTGGGW
jgi:hypothetical protein